MAYMRLVVNPQDDLSFKRVVNEPKRGMGDKSVEKIETFAKIRGESLLQALSDEEVLSTLPGKAYAGVKAMVDCINLCREERENLRVSDIYDNLLVKTGYMKALEDANTVEAEGRIENLMEFKSVIYDYEEEAENPTYRRIMEKITLMAGGGQPRRKPGRRCADDYAQRQGAGISGGISAGNGGRSLSGP